MAGTTAVSPLSSHEEVHESAPIAVASSPKEPTQQERDEHEATHLPYRSWCKHCVRGRGRSEAHKQLQADKSHTVPHVSMDYCFMGQDESKCLPILVIRDHASKFVYSHVVPCKGTSHAYPAAQAFSDIEQLGHSKIVLKNDQEPAIVDLHNAITSRCKDKNIDVIPENSPVDESQSNGVIERAVQDVEGMVRTLKDQLETSYSTKIESGHPVLTWLVNHAGMLLSRFQIGVDGNTAYERLKGKPFRRKVIPFGECVHFQPLGRSACTSTKHVSTS